VELKFESYHEGFGSNLMCPYCGYNYVHHEEIEIFDRCEDEKAGLHVKIDADGAASIDMDLHNNPSPRRHGLAIKIWCEGCDAKSTLTFVQHKGMTYIDIN